MLEFIQFIIYLRDQYETILDRKPRITSVDVNSHYLAEFHIIKFEKIHVLGQFQEVSVLRLVCIPIPNYLLSTKTRQAILWRSNG